jgi:trigger factor
LDQVQNEEVKKSLIGLKKDDVVVFDIQKAYNHDATRIAAILKVDEDIAAELKSNFQLTVKNINRLGESDLNQEFFDKLFGEGVVSTEEEFRAKITEELETMMQQDAERKLQDEIYHYSIDKVNFNLPDEFLKRWLRATNEKLSEDELQGGYKDFATNLKWTLIENKIIKDNNIDIKYDEVFALAKQRLAQQFQMYSPQPIAEEQLAQYTVQYLQNKENANKIFEELKALKVFDYIKSVVTLENKEIGFTDFNKMVAEHKH